MLMSGDMGSLNITATWNLLRVFAKPGLCLPHATVSTFNELPIPLSRAFVGRYGKDGKDEKERRVNIRAVVLDKDDCFAKPHENEVWKPYRVCRLFLSLVLRCSV
jgi:phosphatidylglycerophosphatase GEP4